MRPPFRSQKDTPYQTVGLVNEVVAAGEAETAALIAAKQIAALPAEAVALSR